MLKLLLDMNLSPKLVPVLITAGYESAHWYTFGVPDADDREIVAHAKKEKRLIITNDLDFGTILAETGSDSPSVLLLRYENLSIPFLTPRVIDILVKYERDLAAGALVVADERHIRIRPLPLK